MLTHTQSFLVYVGSSLQAQSPAAGSRMSQDSIRSVSSNSSSHLCCPMSHAQPQLLDLPLHAQLTSTPSVFFTSHRDHHCDPRQGAEFGRLAEQSLFTGYEPNNLIEMCNSEIMPIFVQRSTCRVPTKNSGEDTIATPVGSEVDDAQIVGKLASPLYIHEREREASADRSRVYHSKRKFGVKFITLSTRCRRTCTGVLTQKKVKHRASFRYKGSFRRTSASSRAPGTTSKSSSWR